jgi:exonuclease SbcD
LAARSESAPRGGGLTLLAIGDVHLGTRPSSLPADLADSGVELADLTPEAALQAAVDIAIEKRVDAVLFAGDVVESTNARFEAVRPLESTVRRLEEAGIPVLGVVGNHDVEALPRLVGMIDGFELLGAGGRWQSRVIEKEGRPAVEILGWSFPERRVRSSPVADLLREPLSPSHSGIPRIGLLHGDLDASGGSYAPFTSSELREAGLDAWLLGHIHKPSLPDTTSGANAGGIPSGYLGSLVGLDPGEMGPHGPWLVRVAAGGRVETEHVVNAALRWDRFDLEVGEDEDPDDVGDRLIEQAVAFARRIRDDGSTPRALGLRPRLVGKTRHYDGLRKLIASGPWKGASRHSGETLVFIDKVHDGLELAIDLTEVARGDDPPAILARKLLLLDTPGEDRLALLDEARMELQGRANEACWAALDDQRDVADPLAEEALIALLKKSGTAALGELLDQRDANSGTGA